MIESTPEEIVRCLMRDFSGDRAAAIRYCQTAIVPDGELWPRYQRAAEILRSTCDHNHMVENMTGILNPRFVWKCAACGYVFGFSITNPTPL